MYKLITKCRTCGSKNLSNLLNLGKHEPSNSLKRNLRQKIPSIPLKMLYCKECSTVQLSATAKPSLLFKNYVWVTGTSKLVKKYSKVFYSNIVKKFKKKKIFILEIASNDGTFLKYFKKKKHKGLGIDPAKNIAKVANKEGIPTLDIFFNKSSAEIVKKKHGFPDLIVARNVIPHVENIKSVVEGISKLSDNSSIVAIEFHYSKVILDELHYDSIYHEHIFYFSIKTISNLFKKFGLYPFDVNKSPISGGSLVLYFSKSKLNRTNKLKQYYDLELKNKINSYKTWKKFSISSIKHAKKLKNLIKEIKKTNKLFGYGASARSSTLLNFSKINNNFLDFIIDKNLLKNDKFTAGTNIKINEPNKVKNLIKNYKYCFLLAWNFKDEIMKQLKIMKFKGKIIVPLPNKTKVYEINKIKI